MNLKDARRLWKAIYDEKQEEKVMIVPEYYRPRGRIDYQLLYVSSGTAHFHFDDINNEMIVTAGNMVLCAA